MKYKSHLTNGIKVGIVIILLFWVANIMAIITTVSIADAIIFSSLLLVFATFYILALVKGIYLVIENNRVKYIHMFLRKRMVEIGKINKIQKDLYWGYPSLSLIYEEDGKLKDIKILTSTFKKDTLKQFVFDLKNQNPGIDIDKAVNDLVS